MIYTQLIITIHLTVSIIQAMLEKTGRLMCSNRSVSKALEVALIIRQSHTYAYSATHVENKVTCWNPSPALWINQLFQHFKVHVHATHRHLLLCSKATGHRFHLSSRLLWTKNYALTLRLPLSSLTNAKNDFLFSRWLKFSTSNQQKSQWYPFLR